MAPYDASGGFETCSVMSASGHPDFPGNIHTTTRGRRLLGTQAMYPKQKPTNTSRYPIPSHLLEAKQQGSIHHQLGKSCLEEEEKLWRSSICSRRKNKFGGGGEMGRGTEAFPDLGDHCEHEDCNQLDFLPFTCDGCHQVFCLEHRTYKAHGCPKAEHKSRTVVVCEICSMSIEKQAGEEDNALLEKHERSGSCDPSKKRKPRCPVKRCKEVLTFSNNSTCKICNQNVCLKHRFPSDHACKPRPAVASKLSVFSPMRNGMDCRDRKGSMSSPPSIKAC